MNYLLYNDETKEITNNICIPQGKICDIETYCCIDPTSIFTIGNSPQITNIINNAGYSAGWLGYVVGRSGTTSFSANGAGASIAPMLACVDSGDCETNNLYRNVYLMGTNETDNNSGITVRNGPTGSTTGLTVFNLSIGGVSLSTCAWLVNYDTSGNAKWVGGMGYTAGSGGGTTLYTMTSGGVCAFEDSVYYNAFGNTTQNIFILSGPTGSRVGLTGFGGVGLTSSANVATTTNFLTKFDSSGNPKWTTRVANSSFNSLSRLALSCDAYGSSVCQVGLSISAGTGATGAGELLVYNGPLGENVGIIGQRNNDHYGYTVKYDTNGIAQWLGIVTVGDRSNVMRCRDVAIGEDESVYVCGNYNTPAVSSLITFFDGPTGSKLGLTGVGMPIAINRFNSFVVKYDSSGNSLWFKKLVSLSGTLTAHSIAYTNESIYVSGIYTSGPIGIYEGPSPNNLILTANSGVSGTNDAFVAKFDSNTGNPEWVGRISSDSAQDNNGIVSVDATPEGCYVNCLVSGATGTTNVFGGPTGSGVPTISATYPGVVGTGSPVLVKFNSSGTPQWLVRFAQTSGGGTLYSPYGVSASRNGIYFLTFGRTFVSFPKGFTYYTRNDGTVATKTYSLPFQTRQDGQILIRLDFDGNIQPLFTLGVNSPEKCPTTKTITYRTGNQNPVQIDPSGTMVNPSFGNVSGFTGSTTGSNINLLYNPTSTTDWFIIKNNGFNYY